MSKCKVCGFRLNDDAKKCPMCGAMKGSKKAESRNLENANLLRYFCPACNGQIIGEHRFCPSCGKELSEIANMQDTKEQSGNNCTQCGVLLPIDALFCHKCGARQENTCVKCGAKLQPNAEFCNKCGANQYIGEAFEYELPDYGNCILNSNKCIFKGLKDKSLKNVALPNYFTEIGEKAFNGCSNLTNVTIPNSVKKIGKEAFMGCSNLISVTIPDSVTEIGAEAFAVCTKLKSVTLPDSVTEIRENTFFGCWDLTNITIPTFLTRIEDGAFNMCLSLKSIKFPVSVMEIGKDAFNGCSKLTSVEIPASAIEIGDKAFKGCDCLEDVSIEGLNFSESDIKRVFGEFFNFRQIKIRDKIVHVRSLRHYYD